MSIRYALLGLLAERPCHGYALHAAFEEVVGEMRSLHFGQLYQLLHALERDCYIVANMEQVGNRPTRKVYELTRKGREALRRWLNGKSRAPQLDEDEVWIRLLLAARHDPAVAAQLAQTSIEDCRARVAALREHRETSERLRPRSPLILLRHALRDRALLRAEAELATLETSRRLLTGG